MVCDTWLSHNVSATDAAISVVCDTTWAGGTSDGVESGDLASTATGVGAGAENVSKIF